MNKAIILFAVNFCITSTSSIFGQADSLKEFSVNPKSARPVHWSYEDKNGPQKWGQLSPVYALCSNGKNQSPLNILKSDVKSGKIWKLDYKTSSLKISHNEQVDDIIDNGHTIQVTVDGGNSFSLNNKTYHLKQFHFHTPSEHTIDGKYFPMEIHFVHQNDSGELAVVGVLVEEGKENDNLAKIIANLPSKKGEIKHLKDVELVLQFHLPKTNDAYHYLGSLTTPPCSENVDWLVFRDPIEAGKDQISAIHLKIGPNNRPIQKLNGRLVETDVLKGKIKND